ncbi:MAG TPA: ABC transporter substrate-binding protein, partial [Pirellulales bacterium]|nr:ABC transporter substrate-binding protein [Pirellulales bacterium]
MPVRSCSLAVLLAACVSPATVLPALAAEPDWQRLSERLKGGVLRWGGDAEGGAPFELRDPLDPGRVIGFEVELADALAEKLSQHLGQPLAAEFVQYEWVTLQLGLAKGDFDIILSGYEITAENRRAMRFSRPYYIYAEQLVVRREEEQIHRLADCRDRRVGTMAGSAAERVLAGAGIDTIAFDGQVEPYLDLELGRLDAVLLDTPIVTFYGETNPRFRLAGGHIARGEYGIAARPGDENLIAAIDMALGELMQS